MTAVTDQQVELELNEQTPLKNDLDNSTATDTPANEANKNNNAPKKKFKLLSFNCKGQKNAKKDETMTESYENEKEMKIANNNNAKKSHWWNNNCSKKCTETTEAQIFFGINMVQRDDRNLQSAIDLSYEDVYGEPDNAHSMNGVWKTNYAIFNGVRYFFYKIFSLILSVPFAIIFGILFAFSSALSVYVVVPAGRFLSIPGFWIIKVWQFLISGIFDPIFNAIGQCFNNIKISRYGINSDSTAVIAP